MIGKIDPRVCIGCGLCERLWPSDVIVMNETKKAKVKCPEDCWTCFSCEWSVC